MDESGTTLIYTRWVAEYLVHCRSAVEEFVREINKHTVK
jgi:hypothetical protein